MFKPFAVIALAVIPSLATAAELAGVWQGTLGKSAITVCFNGADGEHGSYYYQRIRTPRLPISPFRSLSSTSLL